MTSNEPRPSSADWTAIPAGATQPPLQRPTLRVQDGDIIVEDAAPNFLVDGDAQIPTTAYVSAAQPQPQPSPITPAPTQGLSALSPVHQSSQITLNSLHPQLSRENTHPSGGGGGHSPPDAGTSSRPNGVGSFRLHFEAQSVPGGGAKIRTTELTASNVQQLAKQSGEPWRYSTTERLWRWLEDAGPPYDVQPSVGVGARTAQQPSIASSQSGAGRGWFTSCFRCMA